MAETAEKLPTETPFKIRSKTDKRKGIQFTGKNGKAVVEFLNKYGAGRATNGGNYVKYTCEEGVFTVRKGQVVSTGLNIPGTEPDLGPEDVVTWDVGVTDALFITDAEDKTEEFAFTVRPDRRIAIQFTGKNGKAVVDFINKRDDGKAINRGRYISYVMFEDAEYNPARILKGDMVTITINADGPEDVSTLTIWKTNTISQYFTIPKSVKLV